MASSTRAAQLIKALTRIVWRVVGRKTSSIMVLQRSTLLAVDNCHKRALLWLQSALGEQSVWMPVELRQPGAGSLVLSCRVNPFNSDRGWKLTHGDLCKVDAPLDEVLPEIGFPIEHVYSSTRCMHTLQGTTFRKGFVTKVATTRSQDTI